jgi:hypothetical protein
MPTTSQSTDGFAVIEIKCPSCGAPLRIPEDATSYTCEFCESALHVSRPSAASASSGIDADGTIRDRATGRGLFQGHIPPAWTVAGTALERTGTLSRPYLPQAALNHPSGALMSLQQGEAGTRMSTGMSALTTFYGQAASPYDTSNYAAMPNPIAVADACANSRAQSLGARDLKLLATMPPVSLEDAQRRAAEHYSVEARGTGVMLNSFLGAQVMRLYGFSLAGASWMMAVFVEAWGAKGGVGGLGGFGALAGGVEEMAERVGGLFSGLTGQMWQGMHNMRANAQAHMQASYAQGNQYAAPPMSAIPQAQPQVQPQPQPQQSSFWSLPDFDQFNQGGTVYWSCDRVLTLTAPEGSFEELFQNDFASVVTSTYVHPDVISLGRAEAQQTNAAIQSNTQVALAQSNAAFNAQQAAHRQQQAAFNAYNDSISAARDARQASFRASTNAQFAGASAGAGGSRADFSEAIRGVNTYVTSDGREVELSVHADVAYENQAGDVVGGPAGFDPGADWTQIPQR